MKILIALALGVGAAFADSQPAASTAPAPSAVQTPASSGISAAPAAGFAQPSVSSALPGAFAAASSSTSVSSSAAAEAAKPAVRLLAPSELPRFEETFASKTGVVKAAKKAIHFLKTQPQPKFFTFGGRQYSPDILVASLEEFVRVVDSAKTADELDAQIKSRFDVFESNGMDGNGKVIFSSYYEPILPASFERSKTYRYPLYRLPPDLITADLGLFDQKLEGRRVIGRVNRRSQTFVPYFTRGEIDIEKALSGRDLEIAWLKNKFDALDLHIEGSGILRFSSGKKLLASFAGTNDQPYNSIGRVFLAAHIFGPQDISTDKIRRYLRTHPEVADWILAQDPRYTFFKLAKLPKDGQPFGTTQESLVPQRAVAIDASVFPLGCLLFFNTVSPRADADGNLLGMFASSRFALGMDTGGAIKGPGRIDIYSGYGPEADTVAHNQWNEGRLYILIKKLPPLKG